MKKSQKTDTYQVKGDELLAKMKEIIREGNVRRVTIKDKEGKTLMVLPLTVGVIGAVALPVLAAVGTVAELVTDCSITVERAD